MMHMSPYQYADATFHDANILCRDANATSIFLNAKCPFTEMQMRLLHDANFPCRVVNAKFIHDDINASLWRCRCKSHFFGIKCHLWVCHDVNVPLWVCHDVNVPLWVCHDANAFYLTQMQVNKKKIISKLRLSSEPGTKMLSKLDLFFPKVIIFWWSLNTQCIILAPKTCFILT